MNKDEVEKRLKHFLAFWRMGESGEDEFGRYTFRGASVKPHEFIPEQQIIRYKLKVNVITL